MRMRLRVSRKRWRTRLHSSNCWYDEALKRRDVNATLQIAKAKYLRRMGANAAAVKLLDVAQRSDTADRYINTKCAKYMLRMNMVRFGTRKNVHFQLFLLRSPKQSKYAASLHARACNRNII